MNFALLAVLCAALTVGSPCSGYPPPVPGQPRRYPVGYNPDVRGRPALNHLVESLKAPELNLPDLNHHDPNHPPDPSGLHGTGLYPYPRNVNPVNSPTPPNSPDRSLSRGRSLKLRRTEKLLSWNPGGCRPGDGYSTVNYNPGDRPPSPPPTDGVDLHLSTLHTDGMPEDIRWDGEATVTEGKEGRKSICAGMWIGNKIIYKTCVNLAPDV